MRAVQAEGRAVALLDRLAWCQDLEEAVTLLVELFELHDLLPVSRGDVRTLCLEAIGHRPLAGMRPDRLVDAVFDWMARRAEA